MHSLSKHWQPFVIVFIVAILSTTFILRNGKHGASTALAGEQLDPLGDVDQDTVESLLEETHLGRDALVALNLSTNQAEQALSTVRTFHQTNSLTLDGLRDTIAAKRQALRLIQAAIRQGPVQEGHAASLAQAIADLNTANAAYVTALAPMKSDINEILSQSQQTSWSAIDGGLGPNMPLGMLELTAQQARDLSKARRHYQWTYAAASSETQRQTARDAWTTAQAQILTDGQEDILAAFAGYYVSSSSTVADAFDEILPDDA